MGKYSSFNATIQYKGGDDKTFTVNPLSQQEIIDGWNLVIPNKKVIREQNESGFPYFKSNEIFFKINLLQLPPHLHKKINYVNNYTQISHYKIRDNCYVYLVQPTIVDEEIKTLFNYVTMYGDVVSYLTDEQKVDFRRCLEKINEQELSGWISIKANRLISKF
jgi:hypothetical protein